MPVSAPRLRGFGLVNGWGNGIAALDGAEPAGTAGLVPVPTPVLAGERFRRATRECLLAVSAVRLALADAGLADTELAGERTGILYVTATGYAAANRAFLEDEGATTLHFPYTSPSAVPGEVTIEFGICGPYVNLMGGGTATLQGLWCAARWLADGIADRVILLTVEAIHDVRDLFARARRLYRGPLVEGGACLLLEPGPTGGEAPLTWASAVASGTRGAGAIDRVLDSVLRGRQPRLVASGVTGSGLRRAERAAFTRRGLDPASAFTAPPRLGESLSAGPALALGHAWARRAERPWLLTSAWRNDYGAMLWP